MDEEIVYFDADGNVLETSEGAVSAVIRELNGDGDIKGETWVTLTE